MKSGLRIGVSLTLLGAILWKLGGIDEVRRAMAEVNYLYVVPIVALSTVDRALMAYKWAWLLRRRGVHLRFLIGMKIYCASMLWGLMFPTTVGADAIRAVSASRHGLDSTQVVASIVIERIIGFLAALLLGLLSLLTLSLLGVVHIDGVFLGWLAILMTIAGAILWTASFNRRWFDLVHDTILWRFRSSRIATRLRQFHVSFRGYGDDTRTLALFFILTFAEQWLRILFAWLVAQSIGVEVGLLFIAGVVPLTMLLSRVPIGIDGLGVFEAIFIVLMSLAGVSAAEALAIALFGRMFEIVSWVPWWAAHVFSGRTVQPPSPPEIAASSHAP